MVVPVNPDIDEAQDVAEENRGHRLQGRETCSLRRLQLQHHDRNDDGKHPIAECFHAALSHVQVRYLSSLIGNRRETDANRRGRSASTAPATPGPPIHVRRSCGATCSSPMLRQRRFNTCQTTFSLMRSPQTVPFLLAYGAKHSPPVLIVPAKVHRSSFSLTQRGIGMVRT